MEYLSSWISGNWIEISGALISLVYLYFSYRQIIFLWPFGIMSALFYIWIYYDSGFYADMSLQVYYVGISVYGWYHWSGGREISKSKGDLRITSLANTSAAILLVVFLALWLVMSQILIRFTDSQVPVMDALTTAGGVVATWMLARKILQHWLIWIIVDSISMGLYIFKELYATAGLFLVYTIVAAAGFFAWKRTMEKKS